MIHPLGVHQDDGPSGTLRVDGDTKIRRCPRTGRAGVSRSEERGESKERGESRASGLDVRSGPARRRVGIEVHPKEWRGVQQ